jgi:hypothetical protein
VRADDHTEHARAHDLGDDRPEWFIEIVKQCSVPVAPEFTG